MLRVTPFHSRTAALCQAQNWRRWAGYLSASSYELNHEREYHAIRNSAALIDVTPLYKYMVRGPDALRLMDRIVTRDVTRCAVGQVAYTTWCDEAGKVIDDGTLSRLDDSIFRLTSGEPNLHWLHENALGMRVEIEDVSDSVAALALQGPRSRAVLEDACQIDLADLRFFRVTEAQLAGVAVTISRTGYTGDLGYEIWIDAEAAIPVWDALVEAGTPHGIVPVGILAMDIARIEAGLLLINGDYVPTRKAFIDAQRSTPLELGLGWTVHLGKQSFVGRDALLDQSRRGPEWQLKGIEVDWASLEHLHAREGLPPDLPRTAWRTSVPVYANGDQVGYATSGCWSPVLKKYIALVHLRAPFAESGTALEMEVTVEHRRKRAAARAVDTPFFDPERKRA